MSLDLLKEFGYLKEANLQENPWEHEVGQAAPVGHPEDDEFGDFEDPHSVTTHHHELQDHPNGDLVSNEIPTEGLETRLPGSGNAAPGLDEVVEDWGDFTDHSGVADSETHIRKVAPNLHPSLPFDNISASEASNSSLKAENNFTAHSLNPSSLESSKTSSIPCSVADKQSVKKLVSSTASIPAVGVVPPSNIPPPSVLLLFIAILFQSLPAEIKTLIAASKLQPGQSVSVNQTSLDEVRLRLSYARATARITAGRKLRWKRDTRLAQSMKIGPAQGGKTGGMKLTGIDRMEGRREDQEAAEVVRIWRQTVGSIRASVTSVNAHYAREKLIVPEMGENMAVRVAKGAEGALTAPKACVLCGLKREERIEKVDVNVEDSFGEWWTEHWGHHDCQRFWEEHEGSLEQRR